MAIAAASRVLQEGTGVQQLSWALDANNEQQRLLEKSKVSKPDLGEMARLERVEESSKGNFVIKKAKNLDNLVEKAQANQRRKILQKTINDRYVADHYYQKANMDELLFEKDGTISKMWQFDYRVHKFMRRKSRKNMIQGMDRYE